LYRNENTTITAATVVSTSWDQNDQRPRDLHARAVRATFREMFATASSLPSFLSTASSSLDAARALTAARLEIVCLTAPRFVVAALNSPRDSPRARGIVTRVASRAFVDDRRAARARRGTAKALVFTSIIFAGFARSWVAWRACARSFDEIVRSSSAVSFTVAERASRVSFQRF
jgi:hypothetical protein